MICSSPVTCGTGAVATTQDDDVLMHHLLWRRLCASAGGVRAACAVIKTAVRVRAREARRRRPTEVIGWEGARGQPFRDDPAARFPVVMP